MKHNPEFDESADMRLVELQRAALGVEARPRTTWESGLHGAAESLATVPETPAASAVIVVELTASPAAGVIPGAVVTVSLSLANDGVQEAHDVRIGVPLPGAATYRNGSFVRDGRPQLDDAADELFEGGTLVASIAPKSRVTFLWKISVRLGNNDLLLAPAASARDAAILGAQSLAVSRKSGAATSFAGEVARSAVLTEEPSASADAKPFYELDDEEQLVHEAADAALAPVGVTTARSDSQPEPKSEPEPEPAPAAPRVPDTVMLFGQIDRLSLSYFERIFNGTKPPTLLNHFMLGGALSCSRTASGADIGGIKAHLDAQGQLLQRIVLHEKLGKKEPIAEYAGKLDVRLDELRPAPAQAPVPADDPRVVALECEISGPACAVLRKMHEERARWDFTKARQFALALQAQRVVLQWQHTAADDALRNYSQVSATQLQRFFVRMRIDRTTGLLFSNDDTLDTAARRLISTLLALFAS